MADNNNYYQIYLNLLTYLFFYVKYLKMEMFIFLFKLVACGSMHFSGKQNLNVCFCQ